VLENPSLKRFKGFFYFLMLNEKRKKKKEKRKKEAIKFISI